LREVDSKDLSTALKGANDEMRDRIFTNVSDRVGTMMKEEMDFSGPVRNERCGRGPASDRSDGEAAGRGRTGYDRARGQQRSVCLAPEKSWVIRAMSPVAVSFFCRGAGLVRSERADSPVDG